MAAFFTNASKVQHNLPSQLSFLPRTQFQTDTPSLTRLTDLKVRKAARSPMKPSHSRSFTQTRLAVCTSTQPAAPSEAHRPTRVCTEPHAPSCSTGTRWEHQCSPGRQPSTRNPVFAYGELTRRLHNTALNLTVMDLIPHFHIYSFLFGVSDTNTKLQLLLEQLQGQLLPKKKCKATLAINVSFVLPFRVLRKCLKSSLCASL